MSRPGNGYGRSLGLGPHQRLTPLRLEMSAVERVVALWAVDVDLVAVELDGVDPNATGAR